MARQTRRRSSRRRSKRGPVRLTPAMRVAAFAIGATVVAFGLLTSLVAVTGVIQIGPSTISTKLESMTPNDLRPSECVGAGIEVSHVTSGGVNVVGVAGGDLILASQDTATIVGGTGNDCIVAGQAAQVDGGGGANDVCIGSATAAMVNCATQIRVP